MSEIARSLGPVLAVVAAVGLPIVLARAILGRADLARLYRAEGDGWPPGIQEEEPRPWRFATPGSAHDGPPDRPAEDAYAVRAGPLTRVRIGRPARSGP